MSNSKRNNKKSKKNNRKNYKVESLEPRLMMDAAVDQWNDELDSITAPSAISETNFDNLLTTKKDDVVGGLFVADASSGDYLQATVNDLIDAKTAYSNDVLVSAQYVLDAVKDDIKQLIADNFDGSNNVSASEIMDAFANDSNTVNGFRHLQAGQYLFNAIPININDAQYRMVNQGDNLIVLVNAFSVRKDLNNNTFWGSSSLWSYLQQQNIQQTFKADVSDTLGVEANFEYVNFNQHYDFSFVLNGNKNDGVNLNSTRSMNIYFNESKNAGAAEKAKFGVLDLMGDTDAGADVAIGFSVNVDENGAVSGKSVSAADFDFAIAEKNDFSSMTFANPDDVSLTKYYTSDDVYWSESGFEKYDDIAMGKILGKLQELSSALIKAQNESVVDFGGILSQNTNALMNVSDMLGDVLNAQPQSVQELINVINSSDYSKNHNVKASLDLNGNLVIPFDLKYIEYELDGNGNKVVKPECAYSVAIAKSKVESLFKGIDVLVNSAIVVNSSANLAFNLVVPLKDSSKATEDSKLKEIGLDCDEFQLGSVIGANTFVASNDMEKLYEGSALVNRASSCVVSKSDSTTTSASYCVNLKQHIYAAYCDNDDSLNIDLSGRDEFNDVNYQTGFVVAWNNKCKKLEYGSKKILIDGLTDAVSALNSIFAGDSQFGSNIKALEFDNSIIILFDGTIDEMDYLDDHIDFIDISDLYEESTLKKIWISNEIGLKKYNAAFNIMVDLNGVSGPKAISFENGYFDKVSCVADIATSIQNKINSAFGWGEYSADKNNRNSVELYVETCSGKIRFSSTKDYVITFSDFSAANWLGFTFSSTSPHLISSNSVHKEAIQIEFKPSSGNVISKVVDLSGLTPFTTNSISVGSILDRVVESVNNSFGFALIERTSDLEIRVTASYKKTYSIYSIQDINGYSIASLLGLTGFSKIADEHSGRDSFAVDATLKEIYQDQSSVVKLENLNFEITNEVRNSNGSYNVAGNYGVFGVNLIGDLNGLKCTTTCTLDSTNLLNENHSMISSQTYEGDAVKKDYLVAPGVTVESVVDTANSLLGDVSQYKNVNYGASPSLYMNNGWADLMKHYGPADPTIDPNDPTVVHPINLTMEIVYDELYDAVATQLMNFFFDPQTGGVSNPTFLESFNLPMQGKSVLDLMDLRGKINEMAKCLSQGNGSTLQNLSLFFSQNLGVALNFSLTSAGIGVDITWNKVAVNQATELGGMDFGIDGFYLGGLVEAYLNMNLTLHAHIDLVYDASKSENGGFVATLANTPEKTYIDGFVYLTAANVVTDLHVSVLEKNGSQDSNRQGVFQIGEGLNGAARSRLFMCANVGAVHDTGANNATSNYRQAVAVRIGGELYASRYGLDAGVIKIGIANGSELNTVSCWDNDLNDYGNGYVWVEKGQELKSVAAWNKEDGGVYNTSAITTGELVVNLTGLTEQLKESFLFEKLRQVADGLNDTVRRLQSNLNLVLSKRNVRSIPLIGDSILGASDCLSDLYTKLVEPFRRYVYKNGGFDERSVAEKLLTLLGKYDADSHPFGLDKLTSLGTSGTWAGIQFDESYNDSGDEYVQYKSVENEAAYWRIRLRGSYNLAKDAAFDLGFAGLGLKADAGVDITLEWTLDIGFGISNKEGAFLLLSNGYDKDDSGHELTKTDVEKQAKDLDQIHAGDDFNLKLTVKPDAFIQGSLGFLALNGLLSKNKYVLNLGIDLNDGNNSNENAGDDWDNDKNADKQINFSNIKSGLSVEAGLRGNLNLNMGMTLGIGGYAMNLPHIDTDFILNWKSELGGSTFGELEEVAFKNIVFDAGSFYYNTIHKIVSKINAVIDPIRPLIDFLQAEIPVLNKLPAGGIHITVLDLIKKYGESKGMDFGFLDDIIELDNVVKKFNDFGEKGIKIPDWIIYTNKSTSSNSSLMDKGKQYLNGKLADANAYAKEYMLNKFPEVVDKIVDYILNYESHLNRTTDKTDSGSLWDKIHFPWPSLSFLDFDFSNLSLDFSNLGFDFDLDFDFDFNFDWNSPEFSFPTWRLPNLPKFNFTSNGSGISLPNLAKWDFEETHSELTTPTFSAKWEFPLFTDPTTSILKLLMGEHVDLIRMDMAPLKFGFDWRKSFSVVGPLCADIGFNFGADIDLCFGYDTYGLECWERTGFKDNWALLNGFYMADWNSDGKDVAEVVFHAGITAGASICGRVGINVGLNMNLNLDFIDPNNDGKIRLSEMASMLSFNPLDTFDISASLEARAYAYLDYFFGRKEWTLWSSGAIELFNTASKARDVKVASVINGDTIVHVGEFAEYRTTGDLSDGNDNVVIAFNGGSANPTRNASITVNGSTDSSVGVEENGDLFVYAGNGVDTIQVTGTNIGCNVVIYGGEGDDNVDFSGASFAKGYGAIVIGGAGNDSIKGAASGLNYLFGDEAVIRYREENEKRKVAGAIVFPSEDGAGTNALIGGTSARNYIFGGFGSDFIVGGSNIDILVGDGGKLEIDSEGNAVVTAHDLFDDGGNDFIYGLDGDDRIYGGAGADTVYGGNGNDEIHAGQGNDTVFGDAGADKIYGDDGVDIIFGDTPADEEMVLANSNNTAGVLPYNYVSKELKEKALDDLLAKDMQTLNPDGSGSTASTQGSTASSQNVEIKLKKFVDSYVDSLKDNEIFSVCSFFGVTNAFDVVAKENSEYVIVNGAYKADRVAFKAIVQEFYENHLVKDVDTNKGFSDAIIDGGNGSDIIFGDDGANVVEGHDYIVGGAGNDFIDGDNGNDTIEGGSGDDIIYGGLGDDTLDGGADNDIVMGDKGWNAKAEKSGYVAQTDQDLASSWFKEANARNLFGDTAKAFATNFKLNENSVSNDNAGSGNDTIITGNGNDIVDGQNGNDTYKVNFNGEYYSGYTNIMESGNDVADSMVVNGTIYNDNVLIRASDEGLGMIALLPGVEGDNGNKTRLERVNYWNKRGGNAGIEKVSLNTGAGNDKISVDSTISSLNVDAGAGDDTITIGQVFKSERSADPNVTNIHDLDAFAGKTAETTLGYVSEGASFASSFIGGDGNDTFNMLHTKAPISLLGGAGDDSFNIASFSEIDQNNDTHTLKNGPVSVIGGVGNDTMTINGTEDDDTFVYTQGTVITPNIEVQSVGVENQNANGGDGDDSFYVLDTPEGSVYQLNGNNGNDSFYNGGIQVKGDAAKEIDLRLNGETETQDNIDIVFVDSASAESKTLAGTISESGFFEYGIKLSKAPKDDETVNITIYAPTVSDENLQRGDRGVFFVKGDKYEPYSFVTLSFNKDNYDTAQNVKIFAPTDLLREGSDYFALLHNVQIEGGADKSVVNDCKNVLVYLDETSKSRTVQNNFVETLTHVVSNAEVVAKEFTIDLNGYPTTDNIKIWYDGLGDSSVFLTTLNGKKLTVSWKNTDPAIFNDPAVPNIIDGTKMYVNYRCSGIGMDDVNVVQLEHKASTLGTLSFYANQSVDAGGYGYGFVGNQVIFHGQKSGKTVALNGFISRGENSGFVTIEDEQESNALIKDIPDVIAVSRNTIEDIKGAVFENGAGDMADFVTDPEMLRYKELRKVASENDGRNEKNESTAADDAKRALIAQAKAEFDETKSVDRVFVNNMDNSFEADSSTKALVDVMGDAVSTSNPKIAAAESALLASDAESIRFAHTDKSHENAADNFAKDISFGNMEYGEINLGTATDTVDVHKSIYREDGFQTFTVINSGKGGDTINVNSYKDGSDDQLVINAGEGDDHVLANNDGVTREGLIAFGGVGDDEIRVHSDSSLVFGDRGQVLYHDENGNVVTRLGDDKTGSLIGSIDESTREAGGSDYATGKVKGDEAYLQTDGVRRGATIARTVTESEGGNDTIVLADGRNVVFGGTNVDIEQVEGDETVVVKGEDKITTGNGDDLVFGDNGYVTFGGNSGIAGGLGMDNVPTVHSEATLSFNFQGPAQSGVGANEQAGVLTDSVNHRVGNWNNIKNPYGRESGTYGNDDKEIVLFDNGTRASAVSVTYGATESHRLNTTDGANIRLHGYDQTPYVSGSNPGDVNLMKSGLDISGNNARNTLLTQVDGLAQYFSEYEVVVYLDMVREISMPNNSVRMVTLYIDTIDENGNYSTEIFDRFYVNDPENNTFHGSWTVATGKTVATATVSNCVIFKSFVDADGVQHTLAGDRIHVEITDPLNGTNGKDRAGIAGIQVCGTLNKQDVAASTAIDQGGYDNIDTNGGDDIVVGGIGGDSIETWGDDHYGIRDNDVVYGDNAKMVFTDRDGDKATAPKISHAESIAVTKFDASYDDTIYTGDGNDVVVGGIGHDFISAGATSVSDTKIEGVTVTSLNFVTESTNESMLIQPNEAAGVVVDNNWHNVYLRNHVMRDRATGNEATPTGYNVTFDYTSITKYGNHTNPHEQVDDAIDVDTANNKLMKTLVMGQQQETLSLTLHNLPGTQSAPCDVYVYVGGKLGQTYAYDYVFEIKGSDNQKFYLNDWIGNGFDGEFKEVTCTSYTQGMLVTGVTPSVTMIGNYVVFRGVTSSDYTVQIRCIDSTVGNQNPNDIPVFTGVQIVSGAKRTADIAVGGDHDKDLVFGDDAKLDFDMDVPFAGNENLNDYKNRVISAASMTLSAEAASNVRTDDEIHTGKDRDVVVGGDGADKIRTNSGDDVAIGDNASLMLENNNPIGVFRPNVEVVLEDNQYFDGTSEAYLDNSNVNEQTMMQKFNSGNIAGIALQQTENGRLDDIVAGTGKNLVFEQETNAAPLYVEQNNQSSGNGTNGSNSGNNGGDPNNNTNGSVEQIVISQRDVSNYISIGAGQTVELVLTDWLEGNQWWTPNVVLQLNGTDGQMHSLTFSWNEIVNNGGSSTLVDTGNHTVNVRDYAVVDIPNGSNVVGEHKIVIRIHSDENVVFFATVANC